MKLRWNRCKKLAVPVIAFIIGLSNLFCVWTVVYAKEVNELHVADKEVQTELEIPIKYLFNDKTEYKVDKLKARKGQKLDSGDLPILPNDMRFIDDFLFYEVKGDGKDEIIRTVEKVEVKDSNSNSTKSKDKGVQTDLVQEESLKKIIAFQKEMEKLNKELKEKDKLSEEQNKRIQELEKKMREAKVNLSKVVEADNNVTTPTVKKEAIDSGISTSKPSIQTSSTNMSMKESAFVSDSKSKQKQENKEEEIPVRYPNKLIPKQAGGKSSQSNMEQKESTTTNKNKGVASAPSKARGAVKENKDNGNKDYKVHHGDEKDSLSKDMYSADARQFVTFTTKNGKIFHLVINHDEDSENVLLLTEVSEDDLLNMVEKKEAPKEVAKEEPVKKEEKSEKKEENSNLGTYFLLFLVIAGALGAGYYFKVIKKKEEKELENFEEAEDDDFFTEVVDLDETEDVKESELEKANEK